MRYESDPDDPDTPGSLNFAETGTSGVNLNAAVNNAAFRNWLKTVAVNPLLRLSAYL